MGIFVSLWPVLQPVVIALVVQGIKFVNDNETFKKYLPIIATVIGGITGAVTGDHAAANGITQGAIAGLAATGLHQAVTQPVAGAKKGKK